jgi:TRAP-type transport system small permease protein
VNESLRENDNERQTEQSQLNKKDKLSRTSKILNAPLNMMLIAGMVVLAAIMLLMTADVFGRYLFRHPLTGADEAVGFLLLCLTAFSIAYALKEKMHIRIDFIVERFPVTIQMALDILAYLVGLLITVLIAWQLFVGAWNYILHPRVTENLNIPYYPFIIILGLGFVVFALTFFTELLAAIKKVVKR